LALDAASGDSSGPSSGFFATKKEHEYLMSTTRATRRGCDEVDDVSNAMDVARVQMWWSLSEKER